MGERQRVVPAAERLDNPCPTSLEGVVFVVDVMERVLVLLLPVGEEAVPAACRGNGVELA